METHENRGEMSETRTWRSRLDNFWYHYKWHSIIAVIVVIAVLICSLQTCTRESFDGFVLYAGKKGISRTENGGTVEYTLFLSAFARICEDTDENGEITPSFLDLYLPSADEMKENGSDLYSLTSENTSRLEYELISGADFFLCLLSEYNYEQYKNWDSLPVFTPIAPYLPEGSDAELYDEYAVKLSSLDFYKLDGISSLPADTLVCFRRLSSVVSAMNRGAKDSYASSEEMLKRLLAFTE